MFQGSGKSTYLKQTALLIILAQIGCFVPAVHAVVPIYNRILSRIGASDDLEHNMSTFTMEMKEMAYILEHATESSLTIIDELGRGTSNIDGISLAFSISEELIRLRTPCLFVTHYSQITSLPALYTAATNIHLKTAIGVLSEGLTYLHTIAQGPCEVKSGYGIMMAKVCNFPEHMISEARAIQRIVRSSYPVLLLDGVCSRRNIDLESIVEKVLMLNESSLSANGKRDYLTDLSRSYQTDREDILARLDALSCGTPTVVTASRDPSILSSSSVFQGPSKSTSSGTEESTNFRATETISCPQPPTAVLSIEPIATTSQEKLSVSQGHKLPKSQVLHSSRPETSGGEQKSIFQSGRISPVRLDLLDTTAAAAGDDDQLFGGPDDIFSDIDIDGAVVKSVHSKEGAEFDLDINSFGLQMQARSEPDRAREGGYADFHSRMDQDEDACELILSPTIRNKRLRSVD